MENLYYLDNAATTKVFEEIFDLMKVNNENSFYNPSASYKPSRKSKENLENARETINKYLNGKNGKLYFTSSATESNNTVFKGLHIRKGQTVLISSGEHPSVYESARLLSQNGITVKEIPIDLSGKVDINKYKELLNDDSVVFVSIIHSSNETGAINDIKRLCKIAKSVNPKIIFHSDGVQAFGKIRVNLLDLGVDLYTISAHKIFAPRGIGGLWIKNGVIVDSLLIGGGQESGFRSSTENVAGAIAFAYSVKKVCDNLQENFDKVLSIKTEFLKKLKESKISEYMIINSNEDNNPYVVSLSFDKIKGEVLMNSLEMDGILISTGSACSAKKAGNRVLSAMGLRESQTIGSVRVSFSPYIVYNLDYIVSSFEKNVLHLYENVNIKK